jgi:hypothetical protein
LPEIKRQSFNKLHFIIAGCLVILLCVLPFQIKIEKTQALADINSQIDNSDMPASVTAAIKLDLVVDDDRLSLGQSRQAVNNYVEFLNEVENYYRQIENSRLEVFFSDRFVHWENLVLEAADAFHLPREIAIALIAAESNYVYSAESSTHACGLAQLISIPDPAYTDASKILGEPVGFGLRCVNQEHNVYLGMATLNIYRRDFNGDLIAAIGAYNMGGDCYSRLLRSRGSDQYFLIKNTARSCKNGEIAYDYKVKIFAYAMYYRKRFMRQDSERLPYLIAYYQ